MTSQAFGADSAPGPPGYAPIPQPAPGLQSVTGRAASPGAAAGGVSRRLGLALLVIATAQLMVVLDGTIVNVALPHIQRALGFSGTGLEWVVNAYAITFGGLLLLGGRAGDILGRRRVFVAGLLLFSAASLLGGFATSAWWLLTARAVQGAGGAVIAPTALALISTNFPQGQERNRAFSVYAAMAGAGAATGLVLGGVLTTYASWRWVFFVNVPIGIVVAAAAPRVLAESPRRPGRIDWAGAVTGCGGVALLVYGLSKAATGADGVSHWGDAQVVASLAAAVVLLVSFVLIEMRSSHPLLPMRVLADRNRSGALLIMLCIATGLFGVFFFLTLFIQTVLGYSPIRAGIAFLPFAVGVVIGSALASPLVARIGPRPLIVAGAAMVAGGMFWYSRLTEHAGYASHLLGPTLVSSFGLGLVFVPLALVALYKVTEQDSGVASSLLNTAQQVGGAIGLALLGTVAWTAVANSVRTQVAAAAKAGRPLPKPGTPPPASIYNHALAVGFPVRSWLPRGSRCSPCSSRSSLSGSAARNWPVPRPSRKRRHRSPRHRSPGLCSGMRTEPPSRRRPVLAGSASRHVITTWDKSAGTTPAPRPTTAPRPRRHHAALRAHLLRLPARARRPPPAARKLHRTGQPRGSAGQGLDTRRCLKQRD